MNKKITIVALVALMLLTAALPASAAIQVTSVEIRGTVANQTAIAGGFNASNISELVWTPQSFAGFFYDLKDNLGKEQLKITSIGINNDTIPEKALVYSTQAEPKQLKVVKEAYNGSGATASSAGLERVGTTAFSSNGEYYVLGWQAETYVAMNGKVDKLAKLIIEHGTSASEKKTLTVGETWDIGNGWTLSAQAIDAKASPRQAWLVLSKDGVKKDDKIVTEKRVYTYVEKSVAGESDVPLFVTYVDSVFAGATTDMVQLRYTWAVSSSVTTVKTGDTYGLFKDAVIDNTAKTITIKNDGAISLSRDATIDLMGNMKFRTADSDTLRFYPKVDYEILAPGVTPTPPPGAGTPNATVVVTTPKINVTGNVTPPPTEKATATATATKKTEPGFEAIIAIAGLLAVAFLVLKQRK